MDSVKQLISHPNTGLVSTFGGVGISFSEAELWLRIAGLSIGLIIGLLNLTCRLSGGKFWFCGKD